MAAADVLKNYLHFEDMEENSFKRMLSNALNKINEENADYVTSLLKADIDEFLKEKFSPDWRNILTMPLCVRRLYAVSYLDDIIDDFKAMKNFRPEYNAGEAEGIEVDEAEKLLKSVRTGTLKQFQNNLINSTSAMKASIIQEQPHFAKPDMTVILNAILKASRRAFYYKELKATVCGEAVTGIWKNENTLRLEIRMLSGVEINMQQKHDSLLHDFVDNFTKKMLAGDTNLKCMWCFRLASDSKTTNPPSHYIAYNQIALRQQCEEPMYIIIHAKNSYGVSDFILAFMLHEQQKGKEWVKLLPSGVTAVKAKGITLHFFLRIDQCQANIKKDSEEALRLESVTGIILDEFLMNNDKAFRTLQDTCQLIPLPPDKRKEHAFPEFGYRDILLIKDVFQAAPTDRLTPIVTNTLNHKDIEIMYWKGDHRRHNNADDEHMLEAIGDGNAMDNKYVTNYGKKKRKLHWCRQEDTKRNKYLGDDMAKNCQTYHSEKCSEIVCAKWTRTRGETCPIQSRKSFSETKKKRKKKAVLPPHAKAKPKKALTKRNPVSAETVGLCPGCLKPADVSKLSVDWKSRIRCTQNNCKARSHIKQWFCADCSKKKATQDKARKTAEVTFARCLCYSRLLSEREQRILRCPQKDCHGWKDFIGVNVPLRQRSRVF